MSIVSKKGDKGKTGLYKGQKVYKDDLRIDASGDIDELNACLGLVKARSKIRKNKNLIAAAQKSLMLVAAEIASGPASTGKRINKKDVARLDAAIADLEKRIKLKKSFYLPGGNSESAAFDIARAVARRNERKIVRLKRKKLLKNPDVLSYLNRLSDLLFLLARARGKKL